MATTVKHEITVRVCDVDGLRTLAIELARIAPSRDIELSAIVTARVEQEPIAKRIEERVRYYMENVPQLSFKGLMRSLSRRSDALRIAQPSPTMMGDALCAMAVPDRYEAIVAWAESERTSLPDLVMILARLETTWRERSVVDGVRKALKKGGAL